MAIYCDFLKKFLFNWYTLIMIKLHVACKSIKQVWPFLHLLIKPYKTYMKLKKSSNHAADFKKNTHETAKL